MVDKERTKDIVENAVDLWITWQLLKVQWRNI
jgi:hypothetical protein